MATIEETIKLVDEAVPNAYTQRRKFAWVSELEGKLGLNVFLMDIAQVKELQYRYPEDLGTELMVVFPHDGIYEAWLEARIYYANGEYERYQNAMARYNAEYGDFVRWFASVYAPAQGYGRSEFHAG